jgi:hypothetical protein
MVDKTAQYNSTILFNLTADKYGLNETKNFS